MPRTVLNGTTIHYQQLGQGPDMLLLHGLYSNIAFWWGHIAPILARHHRVTALDLRGHGFSGMTERGYGAAELSSDVTALMVHLGITDAHLVGHSYGGAIALATAIRQSDLVERLTLADAWVPSLQSQSPLPNVRSWPALRERLRERGIDVEGELPRVAMAFLEELVEAPDTARGKGTEAIDLAAWVPNNRRSHGLRRWRRLMATTHAWREFHNTELLDEESLSRLDKPVMLIYGLRSKYLKTRDELLRVLPKATSCDVSGGHYFPIAQPRLLTDLIEHETGTFENSDRDRIAVQ